MSDTRYTILHNIILEKLQQISKLAVVYEYPTLEPSEFPFAYFVPAQGESEWQTNAEDERIYAFEVYIYYETKLNGIGYAIKALEDATDDVLDIFTYDKQLSSNPPSAQERLLSSGYEGDCMISVEPVNAGWEEVGEKDLIRSKILLKIHLTVSNL